MSNIEENRLWAYKTIAKLCPRDLVDVEKVRIGRYEDGGYVLAGAFWGVNSLLSYGVGHDVTFEKAMAELGINIFMFDHTVDRPPSDHERFSFFKEGVSDIDDDDDSKLSTLRNHIARIGLDNLTNGILKVDIEGDELGVFTEYNRNILNIFSQIVFELHWLHRLESREYSEKVSGLLDCLGCDFTLVHVHANNCAPVVNVSGFIVPDVVELSYVRTADFPTRPSETLYPTPFDVPNNRLLQDHLLHAFPFLPGSEQWIASGAMLRSLEYAARRSD